MKNNVTTRSLENKTLGQYPNVFLNKIQPPSFVNMAMRDTINKKKRKNNKKQINNQIFSRKKY